MAGRATQVGEECGCGPRRCLLDKGLQNCQDDLSHFSRCFRVKLYLRNSNLFASLHRVTLSQVAGSLHPLPSGPWSQETGGEKGKHGVGKGGPQVFAPTVGP